MSTQLKLRRGTTAQHSTFTGAEGEVTVDTTKDTLVVHDGTTAGGVPLSKESALTSGLAGKQPLASELTAIAAAGNAMFKNRIINGAMVIDQRNAGASVGNPVGAAYTLDRWLAAGFSSSKYTIQQNAGAVTPPVGFANYLGVTSSSSYSVPAGEYYVINQYIEGFNTADLAWGTASAATITLSFWARSSLTGTFGGALRNSADNRSYPFTYTVSAANTWEQKTITVAGDTSGTWVGATNGVGLRITFSLGSGSTYNGTAGAWAGSNFNSATGAVSVVGTSGATFYITGVQLEKGSTATSFDYRPYGTELALCQRYYFDSAATSTAAVGYFGMPIPTALSIATGIGNFAVTMRATPTVTFKASSPEQAGVGVGAATAGFITLDSFARANKTTGSWTTGASIVGGFTASAEL